MNRNKKNKVRQEQVTNSDKMGYKVWQESQSATRLQSVIVHMPTEYTYFIMHDVH